MFRVLFISMAFLLVSGCAGTQEEPETGPRLDDAAWQKYRQRPKPVPQVKPLTIYGGVASVEFKGEPGEEGTQGEPTGGQPVPVREPENGGASFGGETGIDMNPESDVTPRDYEAGGAGDFEAGGEAAMDLE